MAARNTVSIFFSRAVIFAEKFWLMLTETTCIYMVTALFTSVLQNVVSESTSQL